MTGSDFDTTATAVAEQMSFTKRLGCGEPRKDDAAPAEAPAADGSYRLYGFIPAGTTNETCEVLRRIEGTEISEGIEFQYRFLMQVGFVGEQQLRLMLPECIVLIEGQMLRDLRKKLARRQCTFIQQYSATVRPNAKPQGEPVIDAIQVVRPATG